ncbi:MAG TPA: hypothetical protein VHK69_14515 [Chitinophagaceae bacterium]|jgi:hypothetical protein|nr:hypothetical protein [Chitinophagaceae bacterium]
MRWLRFLSRLAFICNIFFVLTVVLMRLGFIADQAVISTIIIVGYFLGVLCFNPLANLCYGAVLVMRRPLFRHVPRWLVTANFLFLLLQIAFIFFLNDSFHY